MIDRNFTKKSKEITNAIDDLLKEIEYFKTKNKGKVREKIATGLIVRYNSLCSLLFNSQTFYLDYKNKNPDYDRQQLIDFEYKISDYAHNVYDVLEYCLAIYYNSKARSFFKELTTEDITNAKVYSTRLLYLAARWHSLRVMESFDLEKHSLSEHEVPRRKNILKAPSFAIDRLLGTRLGIRYQDRIQPSKAVIAMPPNTCKTYLANCLDLLGIINFHIHYNVTGVHRIMNTATNASEKHGQVVDMLTNPLIIKIFPEYIKYLKGDKIDIFAKNNADVKLLKDIKTGENSFVSDGIETKINGKRINIGTIVDDCSGGDDDADNDDKHKDNTTKVYGDVFERLNDREKCWFLIMGTCYNPYDPQNSTIEEWESTCDMQDHEQFADIRYSKDGDKILCICPVENEKGESRIPRIYTDEDLKAIKLRLERLGKAYLYNLKYMQKSDSREAKPFAWTTLRTYTESDLEGLTEHTQSQIDPNRRSGKNYFAQTFFKKGLWRDELTQKDEEVWFLTDVLFKQKSLGVKDDKDNKFRIEVVDKIFKNKCYQCNVEDNTSNTTSTALKDALKLRHNYVGCTFTDKTTTGLKGETKVTRILQMEETIKTKIIFPSMEYAYKKGGDLLAFMQSLIKWNDKLGQTERNIDDAPDNLQLFARKFIVPTIRAKSQIERGGANKLFNGGRSQSNRVAFGRSRYRH